MNPFPARGLYAITPDTPDDPGVLDALVSAAIAGGASAVQYRAKTVAPRARVAQAESLLRLCRAGGVPLVVNDDVDLAEALGADGVHVGRDDPDPGAARARLGDDAIVGVSCYDSLERARSACAAGASYVAFGSFYPSTVKPGAVRASRSLLSEAAAVLEAPIVAIGGITPENAGALVDAGATVLAVITGIFAAPDPGAAARAYVEVLDAARTELS